MPNFEIGWKMLRSLVSVAVLATVLPGAAHGYKPVVFMHGILGNGNVGPKPFLDWINQSHPCTRLYAIDMYDELNSLTRLTTQVDKIGRKLEQIDKRHKDGYILIGYSQGGIIGRGILQRFPHNVHTFISLSGPLSGIYGRSFLKDYVPKFAPRLFFLVAYSKLGQFFAPCNYWNDPHQQTLYRKYSEFLAVYNNDTANPKSHEFKRNFLRLKKLVLIGGPDDGVIDPWQSSQFGFYDGDEVTDMHRQRLYQTDAFGLKTLDKQGRVHTHTMAGVLHETWYTNYTVFLKFILPYLT